MFAPATGPLCVDDATVHIDTVGDHQLDRAALARDERLHAAVRPVGHGHASGREPREVRAAARVGGLQAALGERIGVPQSRSLIPTPAASRPSSSSARTRRAPRRGRGAASVDPASTEREDRRGQSRELAPRLALGLLARSPGACLRARRARVAPAARAARRARRRGQRVPRPRHRFHPVLMTVASIQGNGLARSSTSGARASAQSAPFSRRRRSRSSATPREARAHGRFGDAEAARDLVDREMVEVVQDQRRAAGLGQREHGLEQPPLRFGSARAPAVRCPRPRAERPSARVRAAPPPSGRAAERRCVRCARASRAGLVRAGVRRGPRPRSPARSRRPRRDRAPGAARGARASAPARAARRGVRGRVPCRARQMQTRAGLCQETCFAPRRCAAAGLPAEALLRSQGGSDDKGAPCALATPS